MGHPSFKVVKVVFPSLFENMMQGVCAVKYEN